MESQRHWSGNVTVDLPPALSANKAWSLLGDFCGIHHWMPTLDTCRLFDGVNGRPGCVRYCCGSAIKTPAGEMVDWAKEKLLEMDDVRRYYTYQVLDNNLGISYYIATLMVVEGNGHSPCKLQWSFVGDPIDGWTLERFVSFLTHRAQTIAHRLKEVTC